MEMKGYNRDDQDIKCGMEVDVNAGGIDIPGQALAMVANGVDETYCKGITDDDELLTWFHKVEKFRSCQQNIPETCQKLKHFLPLDKMIKLLNGQSSQMYMMKNKPIKKGFQFWAIFCQETSFVYICSEWEVGGRESL